MIAERIEKLEHGLANFEKIKRFTLLPKSFTIEAGELTNTLKLRRAIIARRYAVLLRPKHPLHADVAHHAAPRQAFPAMRLRRSA